MYLVMLHEDFSTQIVPYVTKVPPYELLVVGSDTDSVAESLGLGPEQSGVADFLRDVAESLLVRHEVWLYLMFNDEHSGAGPFFVFEITGVERGPTGALVQRPPRPEDVPDWMTWQDSWDRQTALDDERVVHVSLPDAYPAKDLAKVTSELAEINFAGPPS